MMLVLRYCCIMVVFLFSCQKLAGQTPDIYDSVVRDSICKHGKKYNRPAKKAVSLGGQQMTDAFLQQELNKAIPRDSIREGEGLYWWLSLFYLDTLPFKTFTDSGDNLKNIPGSHLSNLNSGTFFRDMNGDSLLDFVYYPDDFSKALFEDKHVYEIFLGQKNGYTIFRFGGFITNLEWSADGILTGIDTFQGECCDNGLCFFRHYSLNDSNRLYELTKQEMVLTCQMKKKK